MPHKHNSVERDRRFRARGIIIDNKNKEVIKALAGDAAESAKYTKWQVDTAIRYQLESADAIATGSSSSTGAAATTRAVPDSSGAASSNDTDWWRSTVADTVSDAAANDMAAWPPWSTVADTVADDGANVGAARDDTVTVSSGWIDPASHSSDSRYADTPWRRLQLRPCTITDSAADSAPHWRWNDSTADEIEGHGSYETWTDAFGRIHCIAESTFETWTDAYGNLHRIRC